MFEPNQNAIDQAISDLRARQPGGFYHTPDDIRFIVASRKWAEAPLVGNFWKSPQYLFWEAVEGALGSYPNQV